MRQWVLGDKEDEGITNRLASQFLSWKIKATLNKADGKLMIVIRCSLTEFGKNGSQAE